MRSTIECYVIITVFITNWTICVAKPHIVMIMADDLGWNDVGFHGSEISTPTIDALAATGVVLNNYYTAPNCGPSRAQFLTGKYLTHLGLQHRNLEACRPNGIPLAQQTIADELKKVGYKSHLIGKWHGGFHTYNHMPTNRGFDSFRGMLNGQADHFDHKKGFQSVKCLDFYNDTIPNAGADGIYSTEYFRLRAHEVIDEHSASGDPMFMFLSFQAPHTPTQAPQEYIERYQHIPHKGRRDYAAMVTAMDDAINSVVVKLLDANMFDNTVIIVSTDNGGQALSGGASNHPLRGNKGNYYEAGIKGVALVSSPLLRRTGDVHSLFHITDWMPTFIHLAGGAAGDWDGVNQWDVLSSGVNSTRTDIMYNIDPLSLTNGKDNRGLIRQAREPTRVIDAAGNVIPKSPVISAYNIEFISAIRSGDWKLITGEIGFDGVVPNPKTNIERYKRFNPQFHFRPSVRLFNIRNDPTENRNLAAQRPDIVLNLVNKLIQHHQTAIPPYYPAVSSGCRPRQFDDVCVWAPYLL